MIAVVLFEFIRVWGDFLFTLTMVDRRELSTLGIGIAMVDRRELSRLGIGIAMVYLESNNLEREFTTYGTQAADVGGGRHDEPGVTPFVAASRSVSRSEARASPERSSRVIYWDCHGTRRWRR